MVQLKCCLHLLDACCLTILQALVQADSSSCCSLKAFFDPRTKCMAGVAVTFGNITKMVGVTALSSRSLVLAAGLSPKLRLHRMKTSSERVM